MRHRFFSGLSIAFVSAFFVTTAFAVADTAAPPTLPPAPKVQERFIVVDYVIAPKVSNEFSPGNFSEGGSYAIRGAAEFTALRLPWMLAGEYRSYTYPHRSGVTPDQFAAAFDGNPCPHAGLPAVLTPAAGDQGCVTALGGSGQVLVPSFAARDTDVDARLALKVANPRIYAGIGFLHRAEYYGYPKQNGLGIGAQKLPDLERVLSPYAGVWYYPNVSGGFTYAPGATALLVGTNDKLEQRLLTYRIGATFRLGASRLFLDAGVLGDTIRGTRNAPSDASHVGSYVGLGIKP